jgi:methionyl-tRNA formyltransferase
LDKIRVLLFGMTGFGNSALKILVSYPRIELLGVLVPKKQDMPFPYYKCEKLQDSVTKIGVTFYEGLKLKEKKTIELIASICPDLIVVSSFNQIIPLAIISIPIVGVINIHPSLLPKYRGATPTVWALLNGEKKTGITVHFIEDERIDCGRIIAQAKLNIETPDTDGILRLKLAQLSESVLTDALNLIFTKDKKTFPLQNESEATYFPKRTLKDAEIDIHRPFKEIVNKIRAMSPYPGAYLTYNSMEYIVKSASLINKKTFKNLPINNNEILVNTLEGVVKFQIAENIRILDRD